jgi:ubiquinone/menaquinone biosynthesis C-methylase UbiE
MSFYESHILPYCIDRVCGAAMLNEPRARAVAKLSGRVLEIGFGSGSNLPFYPDSVREVLAVEPSERAWSLSERRRAAFAGEVTRVALVAGRLELPDASADAALSTFTLCTVPDVQGCLAELRRVLRPGASLHVLEHGAAPDAGVLRVQHVIEPAWKRMAGGCHLTRDVAAELARAGFRITFCEQHYLRRMLRSHGYITHAVAAAR